MEMELTRYGAARVMLSGTGSFPGYRSSACHALE